MKKVFATITALAFITLPLHMRAQDVKPEKKEIEERIEVTEKPEKKEKLEKKETQEIIIRNKSGKDVQLKVEINGDKVTVNGKPLSEFKNNEVTINKRKMIVRDGDDMMTFNFGPGERAFGEAFINGWRGSHEVLRPFLGVTTEKVDEGAKITEVAKESAAAKAGLQKDDIITKIGDDKITDGEALSKIISIKKAKEVVKVYYLRNGKAGNVKATLGERKTQASMPPLAFSGPRGSVRSFTSPRALEDLNMDLNEKFRELEKMKPAEGYNVRPYFEQMENSFPRQKKLGLKIQDTEEGGNVKVLDVEEGSAAEKAGLKKEDIITEIGGVKIKNTDDAREQLFPSEAKSAYTIKAKRNGMEMSFEVKFPKKLKTANL